MNILHWKVGNSICWSGNLSVSAIEDFEHDWMLTFDFLEVLAGIFKGISWNWLIFLQVDKVILAITFAK